MSKGRILVTGASGFLGWNLLRAPWAGWEWIGVSNQHGPQLPRLRLIRCDLTAPDAVSRLLDKTQPDIVLHTAALSTLDACESDPASARKINVEATASLARHCAANDIRLVFTSTDMVFDGRHPPYSETHACTPINTYGRQKAEAEELVRELCPAAAVCRLPLMFGEAGPCALNFLPDWLTRLGAGEDIRAFVDEFRSLINATVALDGLQVVIEQNYSGILHLGGRERISRYDFGLRLCEAWGYDTGLVQPVRQGDLSFRAPRPADVTFDSTRACALGYDPPLLREQLAALRARQQDTAPMT